MLDPYVVLLVGFLHTSDHQQLPAALLSLWRAKQMTCGWGVVFCPDKILSQLHDFECSLVMSHNATALAQLLVEPKQWQHC